MASSNMVRRNELARERGYISYAQQRKYGHHVSNRADLDALPAEARQARERALEAVAKARREGVSIDDAAFASIEPQAVAFWAPGAVTKSGNRWIVSTADRLYRSMYVYSNGAKRAIDVRGSKMASAVGRYHSAIGRYLATGDMSGLQSFAGARVSGVELETDPDVLDSLSRRGVFEFESIYRMVT